MRRARHFLARPLARRAGPLSARRGREERHWPRALPAGHRPRHGATGARCPPPEAETSRDGATGASSSGWRRAVSAGLRVGAAAAPAPASMCPHALI